MPAGLRRAGGILQSQRGFGRCRRVSEVTSTPSAGRETGISLLEVLVAVTVTMLGFLALAQTIVTTHALRRNSDERRLVLSGLRLVEEEVRAVANDARSATEGWSRTVVDAVAGGAVLGTQFTVRGLEPVGPSALVGSLQLVTDETATDEDLGVELGMPRDLDGDGAVSSTDVSDAASMLPVVVTLDYRGVTGVREVKRGFYITGF